MICKKKMYSIHINGECLQHEFDYFALIFFLCTNILEDVFHEELLQQIKKMNKHTHYKHVCISFHSWWSAAHYILLKIMHVGQIVANVIIYIQYKHIHSMRNYSQQTC